MSVMEHFKQQPVHQRDGVDHWFVLFDKHGTLEVYDIAVSEMDTFLEGAVFDHLAGSIPRFNKPPKLKEATQDGGTKS